MRKFLILAVASLFIFSAAPASADLFTLELDAQATYLQIGNIERPDMPGELDSISGLGFGARARLQIFIINILVDYQHLLDNADMLHAGLGLGYRFDALPIIDLYIQGSAGLIMLYADGKAFDTSGVTGEYGAEAGGQLRLGAGIEFPFAADWFAIGVGADAGGHYLSGEFGYDFSVNVHFGLRV